VTAQFVIGAYHRLFHIESFVPDVQGTTYKPDRSTTTSATPSKPT